MGALNTVSSNTSVMNDSYSQMSSTCNGGYMDTTQSIKSDLVLSHCDKAQIAIENDSKQVFSCTIDQMSSIMQKALADAEGTLSNGDPLQPSFLNTVTDKAETTNRIKQIIEQQCGPNPTDPPNVDKDQADKIQKQFVNSNIRCSDSKGVFIKIRNNADAFTACALTAMQDELQSGGATAKGTLNGSSVAIIVVIIVVIIIVVVVASVYGVRKYKAQKAAAAGGTTTVNLTAPAAAPVAPTIAKPSLNGGGRPAYYRS